MTVDPDPDPDPDPDLDAERPTSLVTRSRELLDTGRNRSTELLDQYRDRPLIDIALRLYERDREAAGSIVGSAIALRLFLFFLPAVLFLVGLAGFARQWIDAGRFNANAGLVGGLAAQVDAAFQQSQSARWISAVSGLFGMVLAGRSLSKVIGTSSCLSWRIPVVKTTMRVDGSMVGLLGTVGLVAVIVNRVRADLGFGIASVSFLGAFAVYVVAWVTISLLLPRATSDPGTVLPGAALVATVITGMQAVSQLYLPDRLSRASELYGGIGLTIVALSWFFIVGRAISVSLTLNAVVAERFGSISQVIFALPVIRILPRRSRRIRELFDVGE